LFLAAFRASQPARDRVDARVPAAQAGQRMRLRVAFMVACGTFEHERVLTEFVAEFEYLEVVRHR
jgi:hypothetical protein